MRVMGDQARVLWQLSQESELATWLPGLPVAREPLWQEEQLPLTPSWLKRAFAQLLVLWQVSQVLLDGTWLPGLPVAFEPL